MIVISMRGAPIESLIEEAKRQARNHEPMCHGCEPGSKRALAFEGAYQEQKKELQKYDAIRVVSQFLGGP